MTTGPNIYPPGVLEDLMFPVTPEEPGVEVEDKEDDGTLGHLTREEEAYELPTDDED